MCVLHMRIEIISKTKLVRNYMYIRDSWNRENPIGRIWWNFIYIIREL